MKQAIEKFFHRMAKLFILILPESDFKRRKLSWLETRWKFQRSGYSLELSGREITVRGDDGLVISGDCANVIWSACGVLCHREYDFTGSGNYIMFDIGLNIAITSLFFAGKPEIVHIYGFEPFIPTYIQAVKNIAANPERSSKITAFDYGLGRCSKSIAVHYNKELSGSMSTVKDLFPSRNNAVEKVMIKDASEVLGGLLKLHPQEKRFLKIDCEGAEIEILENLEASGILTKEIDLIIMEWHWGNYCEVSDLLKRNGFIVVCRHDIPRIQGVITAYSTRR